MTNNNPASEPRPRFLDVHAVHSVPFSNLNRDELGLPKTCLFGGERRARVSSQCLKRTVRKHLEAAGTMQAATRSKHLAVDAAETLAAEYAWNADTAQAAASGMLAALNIKPYQNSPRTNVVTFLPDTAAAQLAAIADEHRDALRPAAEAAVDAAEAPAGSPKRAAQAGEALGKALIDPKADLAAHLGEDPAEAKTIIAAVSAVIMSSNPLVALMGRMLTAMPASDVDGAAQVAHAITANAVQTETDYFTAVDDSPSKNADERGAAMLDDREYVSGTFYKYATVDLDYLTRNICNANNANGATVADVARTAAEFAEMFAVCVPSANRTSTAPHTAPSLVLISARTDAPSNYVNAFETAVLPSATGGGYIAESARRLLAEDSHIGRAKVAKSWISASPAADVDDAGDHQTIALSEIADTVSEWLAQTLL